MQSPIIWHTPPVNFLSLMSLTCTTLIARVVCIADCCGLPPEEAVLGKINIQMKSYSRKAVHCNLLHIYTWNSFKLIYLQCSICYATEQLLMHVHSGYIKHKPSFCNKAEAAYTYNYTEEKHLMCPNMTASQGTHNMWLAFRPYH